LPGSLLAELTKGLSNQKLIPWIILILARETWSGNNLPKFLPFQIYPVLKILPELINRTLPTRDQLGAIKNDDFPFKMVFLLPLS